MRRIKEELIIKYNNDNDNNKLNIIN